MMDLSAIPFIQARWIIATSGRVVDYVVLHTMEAPETEGRALSCANYFHSLDTKPASTHYAVDDETEYGCVSLKDVCYGANGVNHNGIHIEHAGYAAQSDMDWTDDYSRKMLTRSAALTAELCRMFRIPAVYRDDLALTAGPTAGGRGITTHRAAERAFPYGGHTDPGPHFPMDYYIAQVEDFLMDQATFARFRAESLGPPEVSRTYLHSTGRTIVQVRVRDLTAERQAAQAGMPFQPIYMWLDEQAWMEFTHLEAGSH